jgi:hypothetical protein
MGRRQVVTLMRRTGIAAIYRKPRTSQRHSAHRNLPLSAAADDDHPAESCVGV